MASTPHPLLNWYMSVAAFVEDGAAVVVGLFDLPTGRLLYSNGGLRFLLGMRDGEDPPLDHFVVPTFEHLRASQADGGRIYEGWLTFGGQGVPHRSVHGLVERRGDQILVLAEHDVAEMERINREITALNGEITNLQRELSLRKTALERTLDELRETQMMLIHASKMNALGQVVAGVAHEINNPVSFINSNLYSLHSATADIRQAYEALEALVGTEGTDAQRERAGQIREQADLDFLFSDLDDLLDASIQGLARVKRIVEDLRAFSRLDEAEFKEVDLAENIQSTLAIAQPELRNRITVELDLGALPRIKCYPAELNQVFMNLIVNAAQAIEGTGTLRIRGWDEGRQIGLQFSDTGHGMTPDVMEKLFIPFFTTKPVGSGTGLGLALAYKIIVDHHHGTITADSTPGQGSTFTITIPKDLSHD
ncbi:MAG TPA: ATP-binding protein [Aggregatilinea sp.]|uniref:sensor histidine kinase n=1 Tax=Aggregatilinea sp. TaxID=2806333 RepID=UPI002BB22244|nr:ATP-binding protein [Aggregatilinea sp.]HML23179.1 ATP-binding protein [Aggregatilinea sp.]